MALLANVIGLGRLDHELTRERYTDLLDDLCQMLNILTGSDEPIPQPPPPAEGVSADSSSPLLISPLISPSTPQPYPPTTPPTPPPTTPLIEVRDKQEAVWLGKGRVPIGDRTLSLEPQFADVLEALVELGAATKPELQKRSGRDDPGHLLKKLVQRFPDLQPFITLPGRRGRGGYSTTIRREEPTDGRG